MALSRTALYGAISTGVTTAVILNAFEQRPNFFAASMYLSQSSASLMVLTNMFLVFALMTGKFLQTIFFGRLRAIEIDHLYERAWYAVTETCLAMTIFREEFDSRFFLFFTLLLAIKIFHWLAQDRVDYMEQTVEVSRSFHLRMVSIVAILLIIDTCLVMHCLEKIFTRGPNVMIMFAFEFTILASAVLAVGGKYILNLIEARQPETWDNKSIYVFYLELVTDFVRLSTYVAFFVTILTCYGLPLHIVRDLYVTLRSFTTKCRNFMRFRKATQDMDRRYPNATMEELEATGDKTCIVCREDMVHLSQPAPPGEATLGPLDNPKKLPCGHILHFRCLRSWLERQQSCPMCRRPVLDDAQSTRPPNNEPNANNHANVNNPINNNENRGGDNPGQAQPQQPGIVQAHNARFQMPHTQNIDPIQLPRDFRLPPGWALLPVSPVEPTAANMNIRPGDRSSDVSRPLAEISGLHLPPLIPLFGDSHNLPIPNAIPIASLTNDEIAQMEASTRRTIETRLRVLREVQDRVNEGITMLTRLQTVPTSPRSSPAETMSTNDDRIDGMSNGEAGPTSSRHRERTHHTTDRCAEDSPQPSTI